MARRPVAEKQPAGPDFGKIYIRNLIEQTARRNHRPRFIEIQRAAAEAVERKNEPPQDPILKALGLISEAGNNRVRHADAILKALGVN